MRHARTLARVFHTASQNTPMPSYLMPSRALPYHSTFPPARGLLPNVRAPCPIRPASAPKFRAYCAPGRAPLRLALFAPVLAHVWHVSMHPHLDAADVPPKQGRHTIALGARQLAS